MMSAILLLLAIGLLLNAGRVFAQVDICQDNCASSDRLTGPRRMENTLPHPWSQAVFPTRLTGFCKMGCQFFFSEFPVNTTCKMLCDYTYRYEVTVGYTDLAEQAMNECQDGCDIALQVCQPGYYCISGQMLPCQAGRYRDTIPDLSIASLNAATVCAECPPGRYRASERGRRQDDCAKCPRGKYASVTGSVLVSDCVRCPAGKNAEIEGMSECKCITDESCNMENYFAEEVDYFRPSVPYVGRW